MKRFSPLFLSYIFPVLAVLLVSYTYENGSSSKSYLCRHQYALCTSALCIPQPGDPTKAICFCDVEEGPSMATVPCKTIRPCTESHGIHTVFSTFSLEQFMGGKKGMKCPSGTPWTWCLNKRCTVDPNNPKKAICLCDVMRTEKWMTLGGNCDTTTCNTGYWSGAALDDFNEGVEFLMKALGIEHSPVKWCPAT